MKTYQSAITATIAAFLSTSASAGIHFRACQKPVGIQSFSLEEMSGTWFEAYRDSYALEAYDCSH